jgi:hypothetical protein
MRRILPICLVLCALAACQPRMPLSRIEASSAARNWCLRDGHAWGDPVEVAEPGAPDAEGRRWWTVRFPGKGRTLLVNADSGWVKLAP